MIDKRKPVDTPKEEWKGNEAGKGKKNYKTVKNKFRTPKDELNEWKTPKSNNKILEKKFPQ